MVRPGEEGSGGMDSFKRDVVATAEVEMDLGEDLYIKVTKNRQDKPIRNPMKMTHRKFVPGSRIWLNS